MNGKEKLFKTLLFFIVLMLPVMGYAQKRYTVYKTNGEKVVFEYSEIDSVVFKNYSVAPMPEDCEYVDLGLSVKWATHNMGADKISDCGDYFAWGELKTKNSFTEKSCTTFYEEIADFSGNPKYDAATNSFGEGWRIPTHEEQEELCNMCLWEWTELNGRGGFKVTGPSGNAIFLPAGGLKYGTHVSEDNINGYYWASTPDQVGLAFCMSFMKGDYCGGYCIAYRDNGFFIRPVHD